MLLDRFTASYYQSRGKLKSLVTLKKLELQRDVGVLFSKDREGLARCLINFRRSDILRSAQTLTDTYKVTFFRFKTRYTLLQSLLPWRTLISPAYQLPRLARYLQAVFIVTNLLKELIKLKT